jgi:hypothetical protein
MVKWYTSLFIARNTSVLSVESLAQIIYPWSRQPLTPQTPVQYYGLGVELIFEDPPQSPPPLPSAPQPIGIFYEGGSMCSFLSIALWNGTVNPFNGETLKTLPVVSVAARNNRILNVTASAWQQAQRDPVGTWADLTSFPYGWGASDPTLTDALLIALNQAFYFAAQSFPETDHK